ncbi:hypothetical protein GCM10010389_01880 [Streptomyces echinoruber]|uniref:Uncharacterized protein n=1 Tax=Streptomyces echinoruber TaxID=68898 RepID=A0A918QT84_9ACTN|nr:hypothetical protein GCM10010389_01880 [Streptomyces echinoruber]
MRAQAGGAGVDLYGAGGTLSHDGVSFGRVGTGRGGRSFDAVTGSLRGRAHVTDPREEPASPSVSRRRDIKASRLEASRHRGLDTTAHRRGTGPGSEVRDSERGA